MLVAMRAQPPRIGGRRRSVRPGHSLDCRRWPHHAGDRAGHRARPVALRRWDATAPTDPSLTIDVIGHQWWWEARYRFPNLPDQFATANEIHIPANTSVRLVLTSKDVIHSFWVPQLQGKIDLIPGETNEMRVFAKQPGTYRGACAEFCGLEHAKMGIVVIAEDSATFKQWARQQLTDAATPTDSLAIEGKQLFETGPCSLCHTVRGTPAAGSVAPDLTHVGGRSHDRRGRAAQHVRQSGGMDCERAGAQAGRTHADGDDVLGTTAAGGGCIHVRVEVMAMSRLWNDQVRSPSRMKGGWR